MHMTNEKIVVAENATVEFRIVSKEDKEVQFDPTGYNEYSNVKNGKDIIFITNYRKGSYVPRLYIEGKEKRFELNILGFNEGDAKSIWLGYVESLKYPILILSVVLLLVMTKVGRNFLSKIKLQSINISGAQIEFSNFELSLNNEITRTIEELKIKLPSNASARFFPSSLAPEISYYIHLFEFLDRINATVEDITVWNAIGAYYFHNSPGRSEYAFKRAIKSDPDDHNAYANLGMLYTLVKGDYSTAMNYFALALNKSKKNRQECPCGNVGLAAIYRRFGKTEEVEFYAKEAEKGFRLLLKENRLDYWSLWGVSWCLAHQKGKLDAAINYGIAAVNLKDDFLVAYYNLACFYARKKDAKKSVHALRQLLQPFRKKLGRFHFEKEMDFISIKDDVNFIRFCNSTGLEYKPK